ncbi:hypothetical protein P4S95_12460 [Aneurinibacillus aneurinilyticus]|jgi:hypothetical protein|uniref:Uncharacterized protein n=2 Tax=Aneurinibacillus aneurinilyticus TaxID=1391 RepID=U1YHE1_ANEAE|nr:hypothetical protein [Aneurinibacillus aneurinilyticus]ERI10196.1 hypothetical protein HMPREF0083_01724 [Aneurinibacillus aneurinilyticus ATCC 12856]MED0671010.1 hypothetical protein [Aneurinibacillus aneurinilyticus]
MKESITIAMKDGNMIMIVAKSMIATIIKNIFLTVTKNMIKNILVIVTKNMIATMITISGVHAIVIRRKNPISTSVIIKATENIYTVNKSLYRLQQFVIPGFDALVM